MEYDFYEENAGKPTNEIIRFFQGKINKKELNAYFTPAFGKYKELILVPLELTNNTNLEAGASFIIEDAKTGIRYHLYTKTKGRYLYEHNLLLERLEESVRDACMARFPDNRQQIIINSRFVFAEFKMEYSEKKGIKISNIREQKGKKDRLFQELLEFLKS